MIHRKMRSWNLKPLFWTYIASSSSETRIRQGTRVSRVGYVSDTDTARIRIHGVSAYPRLNGPETEKWIRILANLPSIRPGPNFSMEVGEEPRGSPAEGHGLAVEEGRGGAPRLLAHPAAFFSSRSGASAEGAAGEEEGGGRPGHGGGPRVWSRRFEPPGERCEGERDAAYRSSFAAAVEVGGGGHGCRREGGGGGREERGRRAVGEAERGRRRRADRGWVAAAELRLP